MPSSSRSLILMSLSAQMVMANLFQGHYEDNIVANIRELKEWDNKHKMPFLYGTVEMKYTFVYCTRLLVMNLIVSKQTLKNSNALKTT